MKNTGETPYTCMETCGQEKPCGNRYCSAHPQHFSQKSKPVKFDLNQRNLNKK